MHEPVLVALPPDRGNIMYCVYPKTSLDKLTDSICAEITEKRGDYPKTVIFVRKYQHCSDLYTILQHKLGKAFTEPPGYPNVSHYRIIEMYSHVLTKEKKEQVLATFIVTNSKLHLVVATTAFGLTRYKTCISLGTP